jgi:hypothetical protein
MIRVVIAYDDTNLRAVLSTELTQAGFSVALKNGISGHCGDTTDITEGGAA